MSVLALEGYESFAQTVNYSGENGYFPYCSYRIENQNVSAGVLVFTIVPDEDGELIGKVLLPVQRSGKVKVG